MNGPYATQGNASALVDQPCKALHILLRPDLLVGTGSGIQVVLSQPLYLNLHEEPGKNPQKGVKKYLTIGFKKRGLKQSQVYNDLLAFRTITASF